MSDLGSVIYNPDDYAKLECGVFKRIQVVMQPLGGSMIAWELQEGFGAFGPFDFYVDVGEAGTNEWTTLNTEPIVNGCMYFDTCQRYWDQLSNVYYRVRLVLPSLTDPNTGTCVVHLSQPQQANGIWSKRDWLLAREIARKEYLLQRKRTNLTARGFILKRRRYGIRCPQCREYDTGEVVNGQCPNCFATGFTGGYYTAINLTLTENAPWQRQFKSDGQISLRNDVIRQGRGISYPYPDTRDVWLRRDTGERFVVESVKTEAEVGGIPVVISLELRLAPVTDIIYTIPLTGFRSSSSTSSQSSSSGAPICGWQTGKETEPEW